MKTGAPAKGRAFCGAGQKARLAAKLTGYKIDIKPESDPGELPPAEEAEVEIEEEPEESVDVEGQRALSHAQGRQSDRRGRGACRRRSPCGSV